MNPPKKAQIMSLLEEGLLYRVIEASLHVSSKTIANVVQNRTSARSRGGQPKITPEIEDFIETNTLTNACYKTVHISEICVSRSESHRQHWNRFRTYAVETNRMHTE